MTAGVHESFRWGAGSVGRTLHARALEPRARHLFTTCDVSFRGPDAAAQYAQLSQEFGLPLDRMVFVKQVHGRSVLIVRPGEAPAADAVEADAIVSTDPSR